MINTVVIGGRLAHDIEVRFTQSGVAVGKFTLAVTRPKYGDRERETDWIDCVLFGKSAEGLQPYLVKGKPIAVVGSLQTRTWEDNEGKKRKGYEVKVDQVRFLPDGKSSGKSQAQASEFEDVPLDMDSLPF